MKTSKRIISFVLCAIMFASCFFCTGKLPEFEAKAADITLGGITQTRVVSNYASVYAGYQSRFFTGSESNEPTNFVIPGLSSSNDYTPQGMTYWEAKEWILISAYDASGSGKHSVIYALDAVTTEFVALFKILNANGSVNTSHGGGIAASEYNFYYADTGSNISYFPLSEMDVPKGTVKEIKLRGSINCGGELGGAATSYCCYEDGVLWAGNFYYSDDSRYSTKAHDKSDSMIVGYRLHGNSSAEEWYYLSTNFNLIKLNTDSTTDQTSGAMTFKTYNTDGANAEIRGKIVTDSALGETTANIGTVELKEGVKYKIEFIADNNLSDMYLFAPASISPHSGLNVKQAQTTTITNLGNGKYHYEMIFTAGLKPAGADCYWPTTQSTNGSFTGTYTLRFDQDSIPAGGRTFNMTDISVTEYVEANGFEPESAYEGTGCAGNPTYVVMIAGIDKIQYAMVYKGKFYISRSWKRTSGDNHTRELMIGDIDLNSPGGSNLSVNGRTRPCHMITLSNNTVTRFGGDNGSSNLNQMLYMGEALCVMDDYLYMFGEGAAWTYNGKESSKCPEPIDVLWKIDQHMIMGEERTYDDTAPQYYEKVMSLSDINLNDDYLIVHESSVKDPVTQMNILYAIDSHGGYGANRLPKQDAGTQANSADSMGIVGYEISNYSTDVVNGKNVIYVPDEVDTTKSLHWQIQGATSGNLRLNNKDLYYAKNNHLYFGSRLFAMTTDSRSNLDKIVLEQYGNAGSGDFRIYYNGETKYYLWCNDGSNQDLIDTYSAFYSNHGKSGYVPQYHGLEEVPGTFHSDADALKTTSAGAKDTANSGNITGSSVGDAMQIIHIYKRVADPYSSAYETRVTTDLSAELQADGTYNIKMETYAISELQFQTVDERPTDFIFVLDTSGSMGNTKDVDGYQRHNSFDLEAAAGTQDAAKKTNDSENSSTVGTYTGNMWVQHTDGEMCRVSVKVQGDGKYWKIGMWATKYYQRVYLWYTHSNGTKYWYHPNTGTWTTTETTYNEAQRIEGDSTDDRYNTNVFYGVCYQKSTESDRMSNMQIAVNQLTWKIQNKAQTTGLDHRIAVVQYGSNSSGSWTNMGMYTNSSTSRVAYTGAGTVSAANYQKAFHSVSQFGNVRDIINNLTASGDTFVDYGMDMAYNIITHSDANYLADGNRSAVVIMITDGCPGFGGSDYSTANTVSNAAIANAYNIKSKGGYVYSVQMGNNSMSGFDMDKYMDLISSEFIYAKSMTDTGDRNTKDIKYRIDVPINGFNLDTLVSSVFESVTSNSTNAIATLNANSILREQLTDAFIIPDNAKTTIQVAKHGYDGLGRLMFNTPTTAESSITAKVDRTNNIIEVTGYDYSSRYVAKSNVGKGDKLIVTISGVVANPDAELVNTSINETGTTAIYQNEAFKSKNSAVKRFPTEHFTIPEYTYVLDYGLPMKDIDINGTLVSVDTSPDKQSTYTTNLQTDVLGVEFVDGKQNMLYSLNSQEGSTERNSRAYVLIQRDDGTYDWFRLNIIPASTVYFEEDKTETLAGTGSYGDWTQVGSTAGKYQTATSEGDIFGNDATLASNEDFSLGTHLETTVSSSNNRSETKTFSFTGTGFDLVSACGANTGIQTVVVRKASDNSLQKVYIVDTYFNDSKYGTIHQAPIVHFEGARDEYIVETTAAYYTFAGALQAQSASAEALGETGIDAYTATAETSVTDDFFASIGMDELIGQDVELVWMDENSVLNGGEGATETIVSTQAGELGSTTTTPAKSLVNYIDGFRIYDPLSPEDANAYYPSTEKSPTHYSLVNNIGNGAMTDQGLIGYVEGGAGSFSFADYTSLKGKGPKNEVYLDNNADGGFAFKIQVNITDYNYVRPFLSIRAVSGNPTVVINGQEISGLTKNERYFDILPAFAAEGALQANSGDNYTYLITVKLKNPSANDLVAIGNLRLTHCTLVPLGTSDINNVARLMTMASSPATYDLNKVYTPASTYTPDPATKLNTDPGLDVEGRIPSYEEYLAINGITPPKDDSHIYSFADKIVAIIEKVIEFIKKVVALVVNTFSSMI